MAPMLVCMEAKGSPGRGKDWGEKEVRVEMKFLTGLQMEPESTQTLICFIGPTEIFLACASGHENSFPLFPHSSTIFFLLLLLLLFLLIPLIIILIVFMMNIIIILITCTYFVNIVMIVNVIFIIF